MQRRAEFKAKKKSSSGQVKDKKYYSAKIAMYTSLQAIAGDAIFAPVVDISSITQRSGHVPGSISSGHVPGSIKQLTDNMTEVFEDV